MSSPMFREPTGGSWSGDITPSIRDLIGRLVFLTPVEGTYDPTAVFGKGTANEKSRPNIRANVLVLDASAFGLIGGELTYGGKGTLAEPYTDKIGTPAHFPGVLVSNDSIVKDLQKLDEERKAGTNGGWMIAIPVEGKGTQGNNPIHCGRIGIDQYGRTRPQAAEIMAFAEAQFGAYLQGALQLATTSTLIPPTPQAGPDVHKRFQERVQARQNAQGGQPQPAAAATYTAPPSAPVTATATATQYAPGPQATATTVPTNPDDACPPGYIQAAWDNIQDPELRAMIWGSIRGAAVQPTH